MTRKQRQAHKRAAKPRVVGPRMQVKDFTELPDELEKMIEAGRLLGVATFYKLTGEHAGQTQLGMMNGGMVVEDVFDLICNVRRMMQDSYGFVDMADSKLTEKVADKTIEHLDSEAKRVHAQRMLDHQKNQTDEQGRGQSDPAYGDGPIT